MCFRKILGPAAILMLLLPASSQAVNDSLNVQEIGNVSSDSIGGLFDVWGWYDSRYSKYYALACSFSSLQGDGGLILIETTDPANPVVMDTLTDASGHRHVADVKVFGDYAYVANEKEHGTDTGEIWIFYMPDAVDSPNDPPANVLTLIDDESQNPDAPISSCHNLYVTEDYLLLAEGYHFAGSDRELAVLKTSNGATPDNPSLLVVWDGSDFDTGTYTWPHDVYARGDTAFIFAFGSGVYRVEFDGSNGDIDDWTKVWYDRFRGDVKNNYPYGTFECIYDGDTSYVSKTPFTHSGWLTDDGQYVVVADEGGNDFEVPCLPKHAPCIRIFDVDDFWDVSDPARDTIISLANAFDIIWDDTESKDTYVIGPSEIDDAAPDDTPCPTDDCFSGSPPPSYGSLGVHNPLIKRRLLFNAWYDRELHVIDIRDIDNTNHDIYHAGFYDHDTGPDGGWSVGGAFGVYPYSPDGYVYVSGDGLYIYRYGITGTVSQDSTLAGDVYIYDTLTVSSGARLDFAAGTDVYMFKNALIRVEGTLIANGTSTDSVRFIVLGGGPKPGDWEGIYLSTNAACTLSYCSVTMAVVGVDMADSTDARITHCNLSNNLSHAVYVDGGTLRLEISTLKWNSTGVYLRENSQAHIKDCDFDKNSSAGVIDYKGWLYMKDCNIENSGTYGLLAHESVDSVTGTTFVNGKYGIRCYGDAYGLYENCSVTHPSTVGTSYYGIYALQSPWNKPDVYVQSDSIDGFMQGGIYFNGASNNSIITDTKVISSGTDGVYYKDTAGKIIGGTGTYNLFQGHTNGLYITGSSSSPKVRRTKFWENSSEGAFVASGAWADFGTMPDSGQNSFKNSSPSLGYHDLHNANSQAITAVYNYWGEPTPNISQIVNATYLPYLSSDPLPKVAPVEVPEMLPEDFVISKIYPNPSNPVSAISFNLSSPEHVTVVIYNVLGQEVRTLLDDYVSAGLSTLIWDGRDQSGDHVSSGIYLCQLRTAEKQKTIKMTVLR